MSVINNILELIAKLSDKEKTDLKVQLLKDSAEATTTLENFITTERFAPGRVVLIVEVFTLLETVVVLMEHNAFFAVIAKSPLL